MIGNGPRRRGERGGAPATSWCDPAGASPAQVRSSVRLVASVAQVHRRRWLRSVHSGCMGCGIEPRKVRHLGRQESQMLGWRGVERDAQLVADWDADHGAGLFLFDREK